MFALSATGSRFEDHIWCVSSGHGKQQCHWWRAACGVRRPVQLEKSKQHLGHTGQHDPPRSKSLSGTRSVARVCDNLINALYLLAKQYRDGGSPVRGLAQGLQERRRLKMMEELRKFNMMEELRSHQDWLEKSAGIAGRKAKVFRGLP